MNNSKNAFAVLVSVFAIATSTFSQGLIGFANDPRAFITESITGENAALGTQVGLYWTYESAPDFMELGGVTTINSVPGLFQGGSTDLGVPIGTSVLVEIRAWSNRDASSWEEAAELGSGSFGVSGQLLPVALGGGGSPVPNLVIDAGLQGFALTPIPEPSIIAFGILGGVGALVLLLRRKGQQPRLFPVNL